MCYKIDQPYIKTRKVRGREGWGGGESKGDRNRLTLMALTRAAVLLATSLALCTKCRLATGLAVLEEARRQALQSAEVCLATTVAADSTCKPKTSRRRPP